MFKNNEEEWIPCSDWGREQKKRNEEYLRELAQVKRTARRKRKSKSKSKRIRVAVCRDHGTCKVCPSPLGPSNKSGVCSKCYSKYRSVAKGPRPACPKCGVLMLRSNKLGVCRKCFRKPLQRRRCAKCDNLLHPTNKTGLCMMHTGSARQLAYLERKKAA
jgi:hypothetical protein